MVISTAAAGIREYPDPLPAGATENQLMFSYRVTTNMAGGQVEFSLPAGWTIISALTDIAQDEETVVDGARPDDPFDRYTLALSPLVEVYERYGTILTDPGVSNASAAFQIVPGAEDTLRTATIAEIVGDAVVGEVPSEVTRARALNGRVTIGATSVLVNLSNEWRAGGEIVVVLRNVQTAVPRSLSERPLEAAPYQGYPVTVKSKRTGRLDLLDPVEIDHDGVPATGMVRATQPNIRVGNILGTRTDDGVADGVQHYGRDQIDRAFTITPDIAYQGETDEIFRVTYTAKGPMYSIKDAADAITITQQAAINITIPGELLSVPLDDGNIDVIARGRVQPSGNLSVGNLTVGATEVVITTPGDSGTDGVVTVNLDRIDDGATITLTYHLRGQDDANDHRLVMEMDDADSLIRVPDGNVSTVSAFTITTDVPVAAGNAVIAP